MKYSTITAGFATLVFSLSAFAMGDKPDFDAVDTDNNGSLSQEEASAAGLDDGKLDRMDTNKDGDVSKDEYTAAHKDKKSDHMGADEERY